MDYWKEYIRDVKGVPGDTIIPSTVGGSSFGPYNSIKYAHPNKNGVVASSGEVPASALPAMVEVAVEVGHLTHQEAADLVKTLVDMLVGRGVNTPDLRAAAAFRRERYEQKQREAAGT